jgi:hypothetical protein
MSTDGTIAPRCFEWRVFNPIPSNSAIVPSCAAPELEMGALVPKCPKAGVKGDSGPAWSLSVQGHPLAQSDAGHRDLQCS